MNISQEVGKLPSAASTHLCVSHVRYSTTTCQAGAGGCLLPCITLISPTNYSRKGTELGLGFLPPQCLLFQQHKDNSPSRLACSLAVRTLSWQTWHSFVSGQGWSSVQSHLYPRRGFFCIDQRLTNFLLSWWNNFHAHFQTCDPWWRLWCFGKVLILPESKD